MQFIKNSEKIAPKISLVLLDWSVRESFHLLHYLNQQTLLRDQFEVIVIEYYSTISPAIKKFSDKLDTWVLLEMPPKAYYHKHLMYNVGIVLARGEIIIICDSDAMVKPTFLESILSQFNNNPDLVLHVDEFRNHRRDLYPFCYPTFEEVTGEGCINFLNGKTTGLGWNKDPIHTRNYGACFCARREDLIKIGGADEHIDYVGHVCGPYDLTFRLINAGKKEVWHDHEFLYHTWHPGQAGEDNYFGPHDGQHMSTTSLMALAVRQVQPHVMNAAIQLLQKQPDTDINELLKIIIHPNYQTIIDTEFLEGSQTTDWANKTYQYYLYRGFYITFRDNQYWAETLIQSENASSLHASTLTELKKYIDKQLGYRVHLFLKLANAQRFIIDLARLIKNAIVKKYFTKLNKNESITAAKKQIKFPKKSLFIRAKQKLKEIRRVASIEQDSLSGIIYHLFFLKDSSRVVVLINARLDYWLLSGFKKILRKKFQIFMLKQISSLADLLATEEGNKKLVVLVKRTVYFENQALFPNNLFNYKLVFV